MSCFAIQHFLKIDYVYSSDISGIIYFAIASFLITIILIIAFFKYFKYLFSLIVCIPFIIIIAYLLSFESSNQGYDMDMFVWVIFSLPIIIAIIIMSVIIIIVKIVNKRNTLDNIS